MSRYRDAGVDIDAGARTVALMKDAVRSTYTPDVLSEVGSFGGLFALSSVNATTQQPVLVASTDGVGTKTLVASKLGRYEGLGHDIVNHCTNDILVQGARPLFFLDYVASSRLHPEQIASVVRGAAEACKAVGCVLLGGETAEMPGVYAEPGLDVVGTIVGVVDRERLIDGSRIAPGDVVLALPSSGLHTNGFTLARTALAELDWSAPQDALCGISIGDALLAPHRAYVEPVCALLDAGMDVRGLAHITGGGLYDNVPRILPNGVGVRLERSRWTVPPIFGLIQAHGAVGDVEMHRVFNMGLGMLVVVPAEQAGQACALVDALEVVGQACIAAGNTRVELV